MKSGKVKNNNQEKPVSESPGMLNSNAFTIQLWVVTALESIVEEGENAWNTYYHHVICLWQF